MLKCAIYDNLDLLSFISVCRLFCSIECITALTNNNKTNVFIVNTGNFMLTFMAIGYVLEAQKLVTVSNLSLIQ